MYHCPSFALRRSKIAFKCGPMWDKISILLGASPRHWRTMVNSNIVLTIFHNDQVSQGLCKIIKITFQCILVLQLWGDWPKHVWKKELRMQHKNDVDVYCACFGIRLLTLTSAHMSSLCELVQLVSVIFMKPEHVVKLNIRYIC